MIEIIMDWVVRPFIAVIVFIGAFVTIAAIVRASSFYSEQLKKERQDRIDKTVRK